MLKLKLLLAVLVFLAYSCVKTDMVENEKRLGDLLARERFFELKQWIEKDKPKMSEKSDLLTSAYLKNTFNDNPGSNNAINILFEKYKDDIPDSIIIELYSIQADNYMKLFDYKSCFRVSSVMLENYIESMDSGMIADFRNMQNIYKALVDIEPQTVYVDKDNTIPIHRDIAGLMNIDIVLDDSVYSFIFDTGAGMSIVKKSFAEETGMKLLETSIDVNTATGKVVKSELAVADKLVIGSIVVKNAVFLTVEDEMLEFPQVNYFPLGAIGFPVIEEFGEMTISRGDTLFIPKEPEHDLESNMRLAELNPHLYLFNGKDSLEYSLDTGATKSHLTSEYFNRYLDEFNDEMEPDTITTGSAGGHKDHIAYKMDSLVLKVGNDISVLREIHVYTEFMRTFEGVYGNLGQDFLNQHDHFSLNFEEMNFSFR